MKYFSESKTFIMVECDACKRILNVPQERVKILGNLWEIAPRFYCACGAVADSVTGNRPPRLSAPKASADLLLAAPSRSIYETASAIAGVAVLIMVLGGIWLVWSCVRPANASQPTNSVTATR